MNNPEKILHGFIEISVSGDQLERFLNLCHARRSEEHTSELQSH